MKMGKGARLPCTGEGWVGSLGGHAGREAGKQAPPWHTRPLHTLAALLPRFTAPARQPTSYAASKFFFRMLYTQLRRVPQSWP